MTATIPANGPLDACLGNHGHIISDTEQIDILIRMLFEILRKELVRVWLPDTGGGGVYPANRI